MSTIPSADTTFGFTGPEGRRSTRIERPVPLLITGHDGMGQQFLERTSAVSLNLHGCRYPSRHDCNVGSWITLQIGESPLGEVVTTVRAQVRSLQIPRNPRDLYHVGVELEKPANVWRIPSPPPDWLTAAQKVAGELPSSKEQTAAATGPGRAPTMDDLVNAGFVSTNPETRPAPAPSADEHAGNGEADRRVLSEALAGLAPAITMPSPALPTPPKTSSGFVSTNPETRTSSGLVSTTSLPEGLQSKPSNPETRASAVTVSTDPATQISSAGKSNVTSISATRVSAPADEAVTRSNAEAAAAYARPSRVAITPEKFLAALQPKIEKAAETAILTAVTRHLAPALHAAVNSIDAAREASVKQISDGLAQQRSVVVHSSKEEVLARMEDRLDEVRGRWDSQLDGYRMRAEEIVQRIDRQAGAAQKNLGDAREVTERAVREAQTRINAMVAQALADSLREFDQGIKQASHRYLTNFLEEAQSLTREATAHLESNVAEARATVQTAAGEALGEFRRQAELHATVAATDTTQRVTSALSALDAEHRAACDARRNSIQSDVLKSTEQVTEQFRQGLRAFFYSCLVAAVGAVEQHSQATREGFQLDPKNFLPPLEK